MYLIIIYYSYSKITDVSQYNFRQDIVIELSYIYANITSFLHVHPCLYNDPVATERFR